MKDSLTPLHYLQSDTVYLQLMFLPHTLARANGRSLEVRLAPDGRVSLKFTVPYSAF